jgi:small-conductance mechanosensitive channel
MHQVILQIYNFIVRNTAALTLIAGSILAAVLLGLIAHFILFSILRSLGRHRETPVYTSLFQHTRKAARWFMVTLAVNFSLPLLEVEQPDFSAAPEIARSFIAPLIIITLSWFLIQLINVLEDMIFHHYKLERGDLKARKINTQFQLLKRILIIAIIIFAVGTILMTFDRIRQLGATILASAGIIGIIVGVAAQRSVANLLAGIQIALTEPIRLGDTVVVEGEFGTIEEITLTYVVVRIWDKRRLVLPIMYFIEKPFQNWTRESSNILGTVYVYTDYTIPVQAVRTEFLRLVQASPLWDGATAGLQVTALSGETVELRAVMSAGMAGDLWDLRCEIREKLVEFIQQSYPESLPKFRAEIRDTGNGKGMEGGSQKTE